MSPLPHHIKLEESQRHSTPQQVVKRCQIILQSAEGKSDKAIARQLGINRHTCRLWREWNTEPTPFVWTAKAEDILVKVERCRQRLEEISPGCTKPKKRLKKAA